MFTSHCMYQWQVCVYTIHVLRMLGLHDRGFIFSVISSDVGKTGILHAVNTFRFSHFVTSFT